VGPTGTVETVWIAGVIVERWECVLFEACRVDQVEQRNEVTEVDGDLCGRIGRKDERPRVERDERDLERRMRPQ